LRRKSLEFDKILKAGRAHLQDGAPMTLGQEFNAYGSSIERSSLRIKVAAEHLLELNIGAGTVGTGLNVDPTYITQVIEGLCRFTGLRFRNADEYFRISQSAADFLQFSSSLKELAVELIKIAGDMRLLSSGPMSGLGEINLPVLLPEPSAVLPGVLPDRPDPVVAECVTMVAYQVVGNDTAVTLAASAGQLELNVMTPVIIHNILHSLDLLRHAILAFNKWCVSGITANADRCWALLDRTVMNVIALTPHLGYETVTALARASLETGRTVRELVLAQGLMTPQEVDHALKQKRIAQPGIMASTTGHTTAGNS
jgi:aspartate ammonia-lyase